MTNDDFLLSYGFVKSKSVCDFSNVIWYWYVCDKLAMCVCGKLKWIEMNWMSPLQWCHLTTSKWYNHITFISHVRTTCSLIAFIRLYHLSEREILRLMNIFIRYDYVLWLNLLAEEMHMMRKWNDKIFELKNKIQNKNYCTLNTVFIKFITKKK